jgi:hypothetical protein
MRGINWIDLGQIAGSCECGDELLGFLKFGEFLE